MWSIEKFVIAKLNHLTEGDSNVIDKPLTNSNSKVHIEVDLTLDKVTSKRLQKSMIKLNKTLYYIYKASIELNHYATDTLPFDWNHGK